MQDLPKTRAEAIEQGEKYYFSGKPCPKGHISKRKVAGSHCVQCRYEWNAAYKRKRRKENPGTYETGEPCANGHIAPRDYASGSCKECIREGGERHHAKRAKRFQGSDQKFYPMTEPCGNGHTGERLVSNGACRECSRERQRRYYENNKEVCDGRVKEFIEKHRSRYNQYRAQRRAKKVSATPPWANLDELKRIYEECPEGMTVDHIIPLQGELVSGLHVENNLQYLTESENKSKNNSFTPYTK